MQSILVANPKGGAGKTTLATNLAGALAAGGKNVSLWDLDRQQSSHELAGDATGTPAGDRSASTAANRKTATAGARIEAGWCSIRPPACTARILPMP